jgi:epoxide hydrolase
MTGAAMASAPPRPFRAHAAQAEIDDLRRRLSATRWARLPAGEQPYGVPRRMVQDLVTYWRDAYDWRRAEAALNRHPQFTVTIDGADVHFLHIRSPRPGAIPLVLTHGWPGTVIEFLDVIDALADPPLDGERARLAFDLVIPSLPGAAWSGPTPDSGWGPQRIARAWDELMARLGYERYGAAGNDWGAYVSLELARSVPGRLLGAHVTQLTSLPPGEQPYGVPGSDPDDLGQFSAAERAAFDGLRFFQGHLGAYHHLHAQQPDTLAYALADSPAGFLAWCVQVMGDLDPDALLSHVSAHWLTGTVGSALRIYADHEREPAPAGPTAAPVGLAQFARDARPIERFARRDHPGLIAWNAYDCGGHYAARQEPELLAADIRTFFEAVT